MYVIQKKIIIIGLTCLSIYLENENNLYKQFVKKKKNVNVNRA